MKQAVFALIPALALALDTARGAGEAAAEDGKDAPPVWIWSAKDPIKEDEKLFLRREFKLDRKPKSAALEFTCHSYAKIWVNGREAGECVNWKAPASFDIADMLVEGENVIAARARSHGGNPGFLFRLDMGFEEGGRRALISDDSWVMASIAETGWEHADFDASGWESAIEVARHGDPPWGKVLTRDGSLSPASDPIGQAPRRIPAIRVPDGFEVEMVYRVDKETQGSWVSLAADGKGRLYTSDQYGGLFRIVPAPVDAPQGARSTVEKIQSDIGAAQGMCWHDDSLFVFANYGAGLYRLRDSDGDDKLDEVTLLSGVERGDGEHGIHAIVPGPDGRSLYALGGNSTPVPELAGSRPPMHWAADDFLPRFFDPLGHARTYRAPGGWICRFDLASRKWELFASGLRNPYDIAFSPEGELFTFDSDMEWDVGLPWYRPIRVLHLVSGGEYGWRTGSAKWPAYFPDSLPPSMELGRGSPTGVTFGAGAKFPARYQRALFLQCWSFATVYALHLKPSGATWTAEREVFLSGRGLPLTASLINPGDGAMYFTVGGRRMQSALYRVVYRGCEPVTPVPAPPPPTPEAETRRMLETLHGPPQPGAVDKAWPFLTHPDRFIRFAARIALEHQPAEEWRAKALDRAQTSLTALLALVRSDRTVPLADVLRALGKFQWEDLDLAARHELLRVYQLAFLRLGRPSPEARLPLCARFEGAFPAGDDRLNRELASLLVYLGAPGMIKKVLDEMDAGETQEPRIHYLHVLSTATLGWSGDTRRRFFRWFKDAGRFRGGESVQGYVEQMRKRAIEGVFREEKEELLALSETPGGGEPELPLAKGPGKAYAVKDVLALVDGPLRGRSFQNGRKMYAAAQCRSCHIFNGEGAGIGPDLTGAGKRFSLEDFLEATIEPSKAISEQYQVHIIDKNDGNALAGRIVAEDDGLLLVAEDPLHPEKITSVPVGEIAGKSVSPVSMMPPGLLNTLNEEEVKDLIAYVLSMGSPEDPAFRRD